MEKWCNGRDRMKKLKKLLITIAIIIISVAAIVVFIEKDYSSRSTTKDTPKESITLNQKQRSLIGGMISEGQLRIELSGNKAYIIRWLWDGMKYDLKEDFAVALSIYIANKKGNDLHYCTIYDMHSGKKLGKYSSWGFKVY